MAGIHTKTEAGLGDYQVRGWKPWHQHMATVLMAMTFLLEERLGLADDYPLRSCRDVTAVVNQAIRSRQMTLAAIIRQIANPHRLHHAAIRSAKERHRAADISDRHTVTT